MQAQTNTAPLLGDFLTREQLAAELRITPRTLARWRWQRIGPPSVLLCGRRLYRRSDVAAWIEAQREAAK